PDFDLDPTEHWQIQLLVQRSIGVREKAFLGFELGYSLPERYISRPALPVAQAPPAAPPAAAAATAEPYEEPLWQRIWLGKTFDIAVVAVALGVLTVIFFFQDQLVRRPA